MRKTWFAVLAAMMVVSASSAFAAHNIQADSFESAGPEAIPQLIDTASLIGPEYMDLKVKAIMRLGELKAVEAVPVLIDCLGYGSETIVREAGGREIYSYKVRLVSAKALAEIGDDRAVKPLARTVLTDRDNIARRAAVQALGLMGEKARTKDVLTFLYDVLEKTRDNALAADICEALGKIGDKSSFVHLLRVTQGPFLNFVKSKAQEAISDTKWDVPSVFDANGANTNNTSVTPYNK
jgi:HEAT repeat protein